MSYRLQQHVVRFARHTIFCQSPDPDLPACEIVTVDLWEIDK